MERSDHVEKIGRGVLWFSIASACLIVPIAYLRQRTSEAESKEAADKAERAEKAGHEPSRLSLASMGHHMTSFVPTAVGEQGTLWFTNASPRTGFLCVEGVVTNTGTHRTTTSLATCANIAAYATVHLSMMFAGGEMPSICPKDSTCEMALHDAPQVKDSPPDAL